MRKLTFLLFSTTILLTACQGQKQNPYSDLPTFQNEGNPLIRSVYTTHPATMVIDDRLYLLAGHDEFYEDKPGYEGKYGYNVTEWMMYSTTDMQTWTDHGVVLHPTDFSWGVGEAWASQIVRNPLDGKYYFFATLQAGEPFTGKAIGVAVSDNPTGPFVDAIGHPLVEDKMTHNGTRGWWNDSDPTVFFDKDGTPWLCWGNLNCFMAKLKPSLLELDGGIRELEFPDYTEGPWIFERYGIYYLVYASRGVDAERIAYAMSPSIKGPWEPKGDICSYGINSYTIHPAICQFNNKWYFFYHNATLDIEGYHGCSGRRCVCVEELLFNQDGTIQYIDQTIAGVSTNAKSSTLAFQ